MATRQQVADRAGVSVAVVSYVLNNKKLVKEETRQRVLEAVRELGYRPNLVARSLKTKKSNQIAVLVRFLGNPFEAGILLAIESTAKASGYFVFFQTYEEAQEEQLKELFMGRVDGIILLGQFLSSETLDYFISRGIPIVSITRPYTELNDRDMDIRSQWIDIDWHGAMRELVQHLRQQGHERIAFMADSAGIHHYEWRFRACIEALNSAGLRFEPADRLNGGGRFEQAYAELAQRLSLTGSVKQLPFTALICANDLMAAGSLAACRDHGIAVPEQLAIAGCEDILMSAQTNPPLTVLRYPRPEAAEAATRHLLELMDGKNSCSSSTLLKAELVIRGSTAP
ncbi:MULTISPECIES: LacI family DNA-binding transcriptional regulator [unclassified Paenibacillus]|uniref:LacI family DNA-binding transcriptional regulator n=1 Tax=unclassified Paenibacillus TaxID=185978 RepID=UPI0036281E84